MINQAHAETMQQARADVVLLRQQQAQQGDNEEAVVTGQAAGPAKILVGETSNDLDRALGWSDGVCYSPVDGVRKGDELEFDYLGTHDVYKMASREHFLECNFTDALLLGRPGESPFPYTVSADDELEEGSSIYFGCSIGSHCKDGMQKLIVNLESSQDLLSERKKPTSKFYLGMSLDDCAAVHNGEDMASSENGSGDDAENNAKRSVCTDPVLDDDGRFSVSCISGPTTLTPGGVVNNMNFLHYPYPMDRRVVVGHRTWEFVSGDPVIVEGADGGIVEINGVSETARMNDAINSCSRLKLRIRRRPPG